MMSDELLTFVVSWYTRHCDEDWEHSYGVRFVNTRDDGWVVECDLIGTELEGREIGWVSIMPHRPAAGRWRANGLRFEAIAQTGDLWAAFFAFRAFVLNSDLIPGFESEPLLSLLDSRALATQHLVRGGQPVVRVDTLDNPGWTVMARTDGTQGAGRSKPIERIERSETEWLHWWSSTDTFEAACGPGDLPWALRQLNDYVSPTSEGI